MLLEFGKANYLDKARQQPEKVKEAFYKVKNDGLKQTFETIQSKLEEPVPLGYCNVGVIIDSNNPNFIKGDRVISNGSHAETISVSPNLCAKIPDNVDDESAVFTVLGAIGLQGIRLLKPTIGETIVVTGLGLVGLICVQILRANGCQVIGIDYDKSRCELAKSFGANVVNLSNDENPIEFADHLTSGCGVDGVLITASTKSDLPIHQAATMCRMRGRIVLIGVTGLKLSRDDFYKKELSFQVSCSYGPGRYDSDYEEKNRDYPFGFVRWTEKRNFEAILTMIAENKLDLKPLITHRFSFEKSPKAYDLISSNKNFLGILLKYNTSKLDIGEQVIIPLEKNYKSIQGLPNLSFIGAGNYAGKTLIPAFKKQKANLRTIASEKGLSGALKGKKFGFQKITSDPDEIFNDNKTDAVIISTRHNSHAELLINAIKNGKHVFIEKPLAITIEELDNIRAVINNNPKSILMVGFNRRFSPLVQKIKKIIGNPQEPMSIIMTINAGSIPMSHWIQDPEIGGGRIIGEVCHFIDLIRYLTGSKILSFNKVFMNSPSKDTISIQLSFENGSIGNINYLANGNNSISKERLEIFRSGQIIQLDNFKKLNAYGIKGFRRMSLISQDKGQNGCASAFISALKSGGGLPISIEEMMEISQVAIELSKNN